MKDTRKLEGKWQVVEMPDLVDDYLDLTPDPHVYLKVINSKDVDGTYKFGAQSGEFDGQIEKTKENQIILTFTFEGEDEMDPVHGFGTAILIDDNTLKGEMRYHRSDTYRFTWKRVG
ncbi:MAG: hypothetical protein IID16_02360 [Candidatus Marinimicrobia bacterium]|nr:hypothetical protein [Candidatus Neomarinimicrobiota bacterium]